MRLEAVDGKRPAALKTTAALCAQRKTVNGARSSSLIQIGCSTRQLVFMTFVAEDEAAARVVHESEAPDSRGTRDRDHHDGHVLVTRGALDLDRAPQGCEYAPDDAEPWKCLAGSADVQHRCRETWLGREEVDRPRRARARRDRPHLCPGNPADRVLPRRPDLAEGDDGGRAGLHRGLGCPLPC